MDYIATLGIKSVTTLPLGIINASGTVKMWVKSSSGWKSEQLS